MSTVRPLVVKDGQVALADPDDILVVPTVNVDVVDLTLPGGISVGQCVYLSAPLTVSVTDAASLPTSLAIGVYRGIANAVTRLGTVAVQMTTDGLTPAVGALVWLALASADGGTAAGKCTATIPLLTGAIVAPMGKVVDNSLYAAFKTVTVALEIVPPFAIVTPIGVLKPALPGLGLPVPTAALVLAAELDPADAPAFRTVLGLGNAATRDVGTGAGDVAAGNAPAAAAASAVAAIPADGAAIVPSLRTLGTGALQAAAGTAPAAAASAAVAAIPSDGLAGVPSLRTLSTTATSACAGNDARLSDARTPTAHATTHQPGGTDAMAVDAAAATGSLRTLGTGAAQATAGNDARILHNAYWGAVCLVDQALGSDATGARGGLPFATITAALAATTTAGDCVYILPGTYNESLTIPANVAVRGINTRSVTIQKLLVTVDTDLITMGEGCRLEDVTLKLTSAEHHTLRGVVWTGTTSATAKLRGAVVTVDNSTATIGGTSTVVGCQATGTGLPEDEVSAMRAITVNVASIGLGTKRGLLISGATAFNLRDVGIAVTSGGGAGSYIAAETTHVTAILRARLCTFSGVTADISQTAGLITLGNTVLSTSSANGLGFSIVLNPNTTPVIYSDDGGTASGTRYMRPGTGTASTTETFVRIPNRAVVRSISVRAVTGPGAARVDTWTVRINGVDTVVAASLTAAATTAVNEAVSAGSNAAFDLSVKQVAAAGSTTADVAVVVGIY